MAAASLQDNVGVPIGMPVYTADGSRLGVVTAANAYGLRVEQGLLFRRRYAVKLSDVARCEDGVLVLKLTMDQVRQHKG